MQGKSMNVISRDRMAMVHGANVLKTDIVCDNSAIHSIDTAILTPK